ncbi:response regulator transcription factor [Pseudoflavitalea sp. G-6-1-2]|uniref:response regulator n=1 Tax=Pseudoflavitalea sp. G-6-1-2 TaxID=2728841 RepID=UPI00146AE916|nr:response regulator transcription factor [Pseudoflavitalea sp. G-6-1-2]NML21124.1 response regulator transcription factor [Pseudoflavitalea sp. G-6-1-2]
MIKIMIADDHRLVREAWRLLLNRDPRLDVIAVCENGHRVVEASRVLQPQIILMDINMEPMNGIEATRRIREFSDDIRIIGISVHTDLAYVNGLMQAGANGYVTKNSSGEEMIEAILQVMDGQPYFCKEISGITSAAVLAATRAAG